MTQTGIKEIDLLALPYLFDSYDHWEKTVDGEVGEEMAKLINEKSNNDFKVYWLLVCRRQTLLREKAT